MTSKKLIGLAVVGISLLLAGCQTTPNHSFSEWQEVPIGKSRFNVPTVSTIPVTKLEHNDRNNGQVQNEKWELGCGQGFVSSAYTFDVWFTSQTEQELADEAQFRETFENADITISKTYPITSNTNGKAVGYYADAAIGGNSNCKIAKFGFRAANGRKIYDNDQGGIDAVVSVFYCGDSEFDITKLTHGISLVDDRDAYSAAVARLPKLECPSKKTSASLSAIPDNDWGNVQKGSYDRTIALSWGNKLSDGYLDTKVSLKDYGGTLEFVGPDNATCKTQLSIDKYDSPVEGTWFSNCDKGSFASGTFTFDSKRNLIGQGTDQDDEGVEFTLWLPKYNA
ncbi:hypothetical protein ACQ0MK_01615 [Thalassospira lucentensis]|uniref:hypothetical protein n=1 Tax=Thalassospira lucentensis TaxID=168935 RepID=UPI003D2EAB28